MRLYFGIGGEDGLMYVGAAKRVLEVFDAAEFRAFGGVSAGALVAFALALGVTPDELAYLVLNIRLENLEFQPDVYRLIEELGFDSGSKLLSILSEILRGRLGVDDVTFAELWARRSVDLEVQSVDLSRGELVTFSRATEPDMSVLLALRMSTAVPFLFTPVSWRDRLYVDGGLLTQGFRLPAGDEGADVVSVCIQRRPPSRSPGVEYDIGQYAQDVFFCVVEEQNRYPASSFLLKQVEQRAEPLFPVEERRRLLVESGYAQACAWEGLGPREGKTAGEVVLRDDDERGGFRPEAGQQKKGVEPHSCIEVLDSEDKRSGVETGSSSTNVGEGVTRRRVS